FAVGAGHAGGLAGVDLSDGGKVGIQKRQRVAAVGRKQQRHRAALHRDALQRRAFVVIAGELGAGGGVKQGGVGIKHRQQPAAGQPLQPQHHAAGRGRILGGGGGAADLHAVDGGGKLAVPRGD